MAEQPHRPASQDRDQSAFIIKEDQGYAISEFWAERNTDKYSNKDADVDIGNFSFIIGRGLSGCDVANIYIARNLKSDEDHLKGWGDFGNLLYSR